MRSVPSLWIVQLKAASSVATLAAPANPGVAENVFGPVEK